MPRVTISDTDDIYVTQTKSGRTQIGWVVEVEPHDDGSSTIYVDSPCGTRIVLGVVPRGTQYDLPRRRVH